MAQGMGMDVLVLKAGAFGGLLTGSPEDLGGDGITRRMPSIAGKQPVGGLAPQSTPVDAQCIEQFGTYHLHRGPCFLCRPAYSITDPLAVDVADLPDAPLLRDVRPWHKGSSAGSH